MVFEDKRIRGIVCREHFHYHRNMNTFAHTQQPDIMHIMTLIGEPARATILLTLLSGVPRPLVNSPKSVNSPRKRSHPISQSSSAGGSCL